MRGKNRCYVCFRKHDKKHQKFKFPKDFPYEFRWCCNCRSYANILVKTGLQKNIKFMKGYKSRIERIKFIRRAKLLYKLIRLI